MSNARTKRREKLRKKVEFEDDVPRCGNCKCFRPAGFVLINSRPRKHEADCRKHRDIKPRPNSLCRDWLGHDGSTLE